MLRWLGPFLVLTSCGGQAPPTKTQAPLGGEDAVVAGLCDGIRSYDLDDLGCDQLQSAYFQLLEDASDCVLDTDCVALDSRCDQLGIVGACHVAANVCVDQLSLDAIVARWSPCFPAVGCPYDCGPSTPACIGGRCELR